MRRAVILQWRKWISSRQGRRIKTKKITKKKDKSTNVTASKRKYTGIRSSSSDDSSFIKQEASDDKYYWVFKKMDENNTIESKSMTRSAKKSFL